MLTKDLIRCRSLKGVLHPQFVDVEDPEWLTLAEGMLTAYDPENHPLRADIEDFCNSLVNGSDQLQVAKGILKIVDDRAEFSSPSDLDYPAERMKLFTLAASLIRTGKCREEARFHQALQEASENSLLLEGEMLFSDLPENDRLARFRSLTPRQVLERYNVGQVQGLLLRAATLTVTVADSEPARLRRLMRYAKFFRLLCSASRKASDGSLQLVVDGPASVLDQSKRYGLQLASFFPAVCGLKRWEITAEVEWKERPMTLKLDQKSKLVCPYHNAVAWVPEEISLFERHFKETATGWNLLDDAPFLELEDGQLAFPDFTFQDEQGQLIHLELFHRWHATQVLQRLQYCETHPELPLVMGVDRWLLKDEELAERLKNSLWFAQAGYFFRDYPTVEKTLKALEGAVIQVTTAKRPNRKGSQGKKGEEQRMRKLTKES